MTETELVIRGIVDAAVNCVVKGTAAEASNALLAAIDKAMQHAYAEGRSDQAKDEAEMRIELLGRIRSDIQDVRAELVGSKR